MSHKTFTCTHRVSYSECTVGNHVYHSRFLDILERARGEFFRAVKCPFVRMQEENAIFPVVACEMKFHAMARYDDLLTINLWLTALGRARFSCAGRISNSDEQVLFDAVTLIGCTNLEGKPRRMPPMLASALLEYLASAGDGAEQA